MHINVRVAVRDGVRINVCITARARGNVRDKIGMKLHAMRLLIYVHLLIDAEVNVRIDPRINILPSAARQRAG